MAHDSGGSGHEVYSPRDRLVTYAAMRPSAAPGRCAYDLLSQACRLRRQGRKYRGTPSFATGWSCDFLVCSIGGPQGATFAHSSVSGFFAGQRPRNTWCRTPSAAAAVVLSNRLHCAVHEQCRQGTPEASGPAPRLRGVHRWRGRRHAQAAAPVGHLSFIAARRAAAPLHVFGMLNRAGSTVGSTPPPRDARRGLENTRRTRPKTSPGLA